MYSQSQECDSELSQLKQQKAQIEQSIAELRNAIYQDDQIRSSGILRGEGWWLNRQQAQKNMLAYDSSIDSINRRIYQLEENLNLQHTVAKPEPQQDGWQFFFNTNPGMQSSSSGTAVVTCSLM